MDHFGPALAHALIRNIGGAGSRSELDFIAEPVKRMITRQTQAKIWMENALMGPDFPSSKVSDAEKKRFLQQIVR